MVDYTKRPSPGPGPGTSPTPPAGGGPISLTKKGQTVSLAKGGGGGGPIRVNLNWNQAPPEKQGFFKRMAAGGGNIDLDLGCLWELKSGQKGVVQALGNVFGDLDAPPFIKLDKDDRSGAATDGENLFISGVHSNDIERLAVFAFIYEGAKNWSTAGGVVTIHPPSGAPVRIELDETRDGSGMCGVCVISGGPNGFEIERVVEYVQGHRALDELLGWGLNWKAGRK